MPVDIAKLTAANTARWQAMKINPGRMAEVDQVVDRLWTPASKARYATISAATGVPAAFIALAHERESGQNWNRSLAQGDLLTRRSVDVPQGRIPAPAEPPFSFEAAAIDALVACDHVNEWTDWSIGGLLTKLELWNGAGYYLHGVPSAYVWAGSDQYKGGKYDADEHWNPTLWDQQLGTAVLFARMLAIDSELSGQFVLAGVSVLALPDSHPAMLPPPAVPVLHDNAWVQQQMNLLGAREPWRTAILEAMGELKPPGTFPLAVDGNYGRSTTQAVRGFQRQHGDILDDGNAGRTTQPEIEQAVAALT